METVGDRRRRGVKQGTVGVPSAAVENREPRDRQFTEESLETRALVVSVQHIVRQSASSHLEVS